MPITTYNMYLVKHFQAKSPYVAHVIEIATYSKRDRRLGKHFQTALPIILERLYPRCHVVRPMAD